MSNDNSAYSPLKILHHPKIIEAIRGNQFVPPLHVQLIISDLCNQDCGFCAYRMTGYTSNQLFGEPNSKGRINPNRMIEYDKCVEILEDCRKLGTKAVQFTGGGEPTVHPNHKMIFQECLDRDMDLALVTNGVKIDEELCDILMQASWVRISIDSGTAKTYSEIRKVKEEVYGRVWENINDLVECRERVKSDLIIGVGFVITKDNWTEVIDCTIQAKETGIDNIRISAIFQEEGPAYFDGWLEESADLCHQASKESTDSFKVFNNFSNRVDDLLQKSPDYSECNIQKVQTYIGADLNLYRCCILAYNLQGLLGSLKKQTFYDLWHKIYDELKDYDSTTCPRCMYNDKNRTILYAIDSDAKHKNFV